MSLSRYIQSEKIREAKKLLVLTDYSLSDISNLLNFSTQSYFTKFFKHYTNIFLLQYSKKRSNFLCLAYKIRVFLAVPLYLFLYLMNYYISINFGIDIKSDMLFEVLNSLNKFMRELRWNNDFF